MARAVRKLQNGLTNPRRSRDVDTSFVSDEAVHHSLGRRLDAFSEGRVPVDLLANVVEEGELGRRERRKFSRYLVTARQGVDDHVQRARLVLDNEIKA